MNLSHYLKLALRGQLSLRDVYALRKTEVKLSRREVSQLMRAIKKAQRGNA